MGTIRKGEVNIGSTRTSAAGKKKHDILFTASIQ